jgi:hypothetical protein
VAQSPAAGGVDPRVAEGVKSPRRGAHLIVAALLRDP